MPRSQCSTEPDYTLAGQRPLELLQISSMASVLMGSEFSYGQKLAFSSDFAYASSHNTVILHCLSFCHITTTVTGCSGGRYYKKAPKSEMQRHCRQ